MSETIIKGIIASPGIRIGKAYVYQGDTIVIQKYRITDEEVESEISRFENAVAKTKMEIREIQEQIANKLSQEMADIFVSHIMVLEDPQIEEHAKQKIIEEKRNAEWIINDISLELMKGLSLIKDEYLRERIIDISDINKRLISNMLKTKPVTLSDINEEVIVFATDLTPSETAVMNKERILAFVTDKGGKTSHTAIMARALEIPAIVGTIDCSSLVKNGDMVIIDAIFGKIIIQPTDDEISAYMNLRRELEKQERELSKIIKLPTRTIDSTDVFIYGNIEMPEEMKLIRDHGAAGIGLFRSEFLFLDKSLPDEELQFNEYRKVAEFFSPKPVVIRTIDVGGDKVYAYTAPYKEKNPFLGCRAIRFSLAHEDLFRIQLRAILRASHYGHVKLMFPMISVIEEFIKAKSITLEIMDDLRREGIPFDENIPIGIMIEVPSAVINADILCKHADFFSVGTNDLVQYTLAVDRMHEKIAYLYNPLNISVLRLLRQIIDVSNSCKVDLSICGEMAGEPQYTMLLLGLGFRHFSMSATYMFQIKKILRSVTIAECEAMVEAIMKMDKTEDIERHVRFHIKNKFSDFV
jgi:phosphotransferase system enzyme I (PtsI)